MVYLNNKRVLHNGSAPSFQVGCASSILVTRSKSPWSRGLGLHPFTVATRVRIPLEIHDSAKWERHITQNYNW